MVAHLDDVHLVRRQADADTAVSNRCLVQQRATYRVNLYDIVLTQAFYDNLTAFAVSFKVGIVYVRNACCRVFLKYDSFVSQGSRQRGILVENGRLVSRFVEVGQYIQIIQCERSDLPTLFGRNLYRQRLLLRCSRHRGELVAQGISEAHHFGFYRCGNEPQPSPYPSYK